MTFDFKSVDDIIELYVREKKTYVEFRETLESIFGSFVIGSNSDENDDVFLINYPSICDNFDVNDPRYRMLLNSTGHVLAKQPLSIITKLLLPTNLHDTDTVKKMFSTLNWDDVSVTFIYYGQYVVVFNINNKWYMATESNIFEFDTKSLLSTTFSKNFDISTLDAKSIYHFTINNSEIKPVKHILETTLNINRKDIILFHTDDTNDALKTHYPFNLHFSCLDEMLTKMETITSENKLNKKITLEGYTIKVTTNSDVKMYTIYTELYKHLRSTVPNRSNIFQVYIELYQNNKLADILPYISKYSNEIIHRINMSMRTISKEILNIYHATRKMHHKELYKSLPKIYKRVLYNLHGIYITCRRSEINEKDMKDDIEDMIDIGFDENISITVHDVYYYLKELAFDNLIKIYQSRGELINNEITSKYMNSDCIYTLMQTKLLQD